MRVTDPSTRCSIRSSSGTTPPFSPSAPLCHAEKLVAFSCKRRGFCPSCKRRGFCPSCGARRMTEAAALLVEEVLPKDKPLRQWVLSLPYALRFLLARDPRALTCVLGIVYRCAPFASTSRPVSAAAEHSA